MLLTSYAYSNPFSFLIVCCWVESVLFWTLNPYHIWFAKMFWFCIFISILLIVSFDAQKVSNLMMSSLSTFVIVTYAFDIMFLNLWPSSHSWRFPALFSSNSFVILGPQFRSLIHLLFFISSMYRDPNLSFCKWLSIFLAPFHKETILSPSTDLEILLKSVEHRCPWWFLMKNSPWKLSTILK